MSTTGKQVFTTLEKNGTLTVEVATSAFPDPKGDQVLVRMEAAPINPSDLALLFSAADLENAEYSPGKVVAKMPEPFLSGSKGRHGQRMPVGNEGAGTVVATGESPTAKALLGQRVACVPGNAFSEYAIADAKMCLPLGENSCEHGASAFVNPMTALGFVETAKMEGHTAMVHLAAASNLGQMLQRICLEDDLELVNIVRKQEQVDLLKGLGAKYVVNSSDADYMAQLRAAIEQTGAYLGFDPIGGGNNSDNVFKAMEQVAVAKMTEFATILTPSYGFGFTLSGWLLFPFLQKAGMETVQRMRKRVLDNLTTTFASHYQERVTLEQMLEKDAAMDYRAMRTGEKYLVTP